MMNEPTSRDLTRGPATPRRVPGRHLSTTGHATAICPLSHVCPGSRLASRGGGKWSLGGLRLRRGLSAGRSGRHRPAGHSGARGRPRPNPRRRATSSTTATAGPAGRTPNPTGPTVADRFVDPDEDRFDAFNANTWHFKPAPTPWYRTRLASIAMVAVGAGRRRDRRVGRPARLQRPVGHRADPCHPHVGHPDHRRVHAGGHQRTASPATATAAATTTAATATSAPPSPPPVYNRPRSEPRPNRGPEIGVTRTPVTRSPISVAPQPVPGSHADDRLRRRRVIRSGPGRRARDGRRGFAFRTSYRWCSR